MFKKISIVCFVHCDCNHTHTHTPINARNLYKITISFVCMYRRTFSAINCHSRGDITYWEGTVKLISDIYVYSVCCLVN